MFKKTDTRKWISNPCLPDDVTNPLEAKHRVVDKERHHRALPWGFGGFGDGEEHDPEISE